MLRDIGGGDQPARHLDAGGLGLGFPDQAGRAVTGISSNWSL